MSNSTFNEIVIMGATYSEALSVIVLVVSEHAVSILHGAELSFGIRRWEQNYGDEDRKSAELLRSS